MATRIILRNLPNASRRLCGVYSILSRLLLAFGEFLKIIRYLERKDKEGLAFISVGRGSALSMP
jgi:hypothetical protein